MNLARRLQADLGRRWSNLFCPLHCFCMSFFSMGLTVLTIPWEVEASQKATCICRGSVTACLCLAPGTPRQFSVFDCMMSLSLEMAGSQDGWQLSDLHCVVKLKSLISERFRSVLNLYFYLFDRSAHMYAYVRICMHTCAYVCICVHMCVYMCIFIISLHTCACVCIFVHICIHIGAYL